MTPAELQTIRRELGYSQARLAAKLRINVSTVSRWERGTRAIPPYLHVILDVLRDERARRRQRYPATMGAAFRFCRLRALSRWHILLRIKGRARRTPGTEERNDADG